MRYVVTGAAGFIGSHLLRTLLDRGHDAVGGAQLRRELRETLGAASHERESVAAACQLARQLGADAGGGTGDDHRRARNGCGKGHGGRSCQG